MDGIFFLILAFITIIMSVKLSYYGDILGKQSKIGTAIIGGVLIASITCLPELITCISAVVFDNIALSFGDIVGSNLFNIFILAVYNIYFFKSEIFKNTSKKYIFECVVLLTDYIFIMLSINNVFTNITTLILFITYIMYMMMTILNKEEDYFVNEKEEKNVCLKFILTAIFMVLLSILLTYQADKISHLYPKFSSSSIGAILLGITTSLPEVVTTFALLKIGNFNMAISNMLGSNIFNFLVLALADVFTRGKSIYSNVDIYSTYYVIGGIIIMILFISSLLKKINTKIYYIIISIIMISIYFIVWYLQFI